MSFLWASNNLAGFDRWVGRVEAGSFHDATYVNSSIKFYVNSRIDKILDTPQTDVWFHFSFEGGTFTSLMDLALCYIGNEDLNLDLFRLEGNNATFTMQYWNGSTWLNTSISFSVGGSTLANIDVHLVMSDATDGGLIEVYKDDVLQGTSWEDDTVFTAATSVDRFSLQGPVNDVNTDSNFSQFIIATSSTVGCKVVAHTIDADGVTADWTGGYTDIATGATSFPQNTAIAHSNTADQVMLVEPEDVISTALFPVGVVVNAQAKRGTTGPDAIALALRSDGVTYFSDDIVLTEGYKSVSAIWEADPAGPKNWLEATLNAMECGVKSRAS